MEQSIKSIYYTYIKDTGKQLFDWFVNDSSEPDLHALTNKQLINNCFFDTSKLSNTDNIYNIFSYRILQNQLSSWDESNIIASNADEFIYFKINSDKHFLDFFKQPKIDMFNKIFVLIQFYDYLYQNLDSLNYTYKYSDLIEIKCYRLSVNNTHVLSDVDANLNDLLKKHQLYVLSLISSDDFKETIFLISNVIKALFIKINAEIFNEFVVLKFIDGLSVYTPTDSYTYTFYQNLFMNAISPLTAASSTLYQRYGISYGLQVDNPIYTNSQFVFNVSAINSVLIQNIYKNVYSSRNILIDTFDGKQYTILQDSSIQDNKIALSINGNLDTSHNYRITMKKSTSYKYEYYEKIQSIKDIKSDIDLIDNEKRLAMVSYENTKTAYKNIDLISYFFYFLFVCIIILISISEINDFNKYLKIALAFILLTFIVVTYIAYILTFSFTEAFTEPQTVQEIKSDQINNNQTIYDLTTNFFKLLTSYGSMEALNEVYNNLFKIINKDKQRMMFKKSLFENQLQGIKSQRNDEILSVYNKTAFITSLTLFSIVLLLFYWIALRYPQSSTSAIIIAIILSIIIIFYYFKAISQNIRTQSKQFYWSDR